MSSGMVKVAKRRGRVRLESGRVGTLIFWPIPAPFRQPTPTGGRYHGGTKAKVRLDTGAIVSVEPDKVVGVVE